MNNTETTRTRHRWSWRSCFAVVKHKKHHRRSQWVTQRTAEASWHSSPPTDHSLPFWRLPHLFSLPKLTFNGETTSDKQLDADAENVHCPQPSPVNSCLLSEPHDDDQFLPSSCIIEIEPPSVDNHDEYLLDGDSLEQIHPDDLDATVINGTLSTTIRSTHLDAIVEDSNEENSDDLDETIQPVR